MAMLRLGNATANDAADLVAVLDSAIDQLLEQVAAGHRSGHDADTASPAVLARSDSAGCSAGFVDGCRERNIGFQVVARRKNAVSAAIAAANEDVDRWVPALRPDGKADLDPDGEPVAMVADLTKLVDLASWPEGSRLIVRREPLHPGTQKSLRPDLEHRFWGHYTNLEGDPAELDRQMRAHAHVEDHIGHLKDSGLLRFPFSALDANRPWLQVICWAADLVRWFQPLCLAGPLAQALPKKLR